MKQLQHRLLPLLVLLFLLPAPVSAQQPAAGPPPAAPIIRYPYLPGKLTVIGKPQWHTVKPKETLLDIAREYGLGFNDVALLYPNMDPWLPPPRRRIMVPTIWVLPPTRYQELVINIPELRLYFFDRKTKTVQTYPIGIGDEGWETPLGTCRIVRKRTHPTWYIPKSLQAKYHRETVPPGPDNPLGDYFMSLSIKGYGIHGTNVPWGVGRLVSHGCIRCYPEHIRILYPQVKIGTRLEIIYEPIKIGRKFDQIYVEVHPDVYNRLGDFNDYARHKLEESGLGDRIDFNRFMLAVRLKNGVPFNITAINAQHDPADLPPLTELP